MEIDKSRALSNLGRKKMATIILVVEIGNENIENNIPTSNEKTQEKSNMANKLSFLHL